MIVGSQEIIDQEGGGGEGKVLGQAKKLFGQVLQKFLIFGIKVF